MEGAAEIAGGGEVGGGGSGGGAAAGWVLVELRERMRKAGGGYAYKTQTVGGLEGESGTGVPLLDELFKTWVGIAEDMVESCAGLSRDAVR